MFQRITSTSNRNTPSIIPDSDTQMPQDLIGSLWEIIMTMDITSAQMMKLNRKLAHKKNSLSLTFLSVLSIVFINHVIFQVTFFFFNPQKLRNWRRNQATAFSSLMINMSNTLRLEWLFIAI